MTETSAPGRFSGPSDRIDFDRLERESRKLLFLGIFVAVCFHAALGSYFMFRRSEVKVVKPPMMELVIRRPRMTKPFEFKKQRLKRRELSRKAFVAMGRPDIEIKVKGSPDLTPGKVMAYDYKYVPGTGTEEYYFIPERLDIELKALRKPTNQISMKEELITIDDLDTGRYKGLVIKDPNDKQNIKGFIYIATLWGTQLAPAYKRGIIHLSDAVNSYTKIRSKVDKHLLIDSRNLFETPFVCLSVTEGFELTEVEAHNFGEYLRKGGFAVLDNGIPQKDFNPAEAALKKMLHDSLGNDAVLLPIPNSHPLYHCFFDFDKPPMGSEFEDDLFIRSGVGYRNLSQAPVYYLEGIWIDQRLVAIYSDKGYSKCWDKDYDNDPQLKIGVNMVVFALIQEGGIAQRHMEIFSSTK